jgi:hypothetical protein
MNQSFNNRNSAAESVVPLAQYNPPFSLEQVMKSISDSHSLSIFMIIADQEKIKTQVILNKLKITRKQCYQRLSKLIRAGLIRRPSTGRGHYSPSAFGKVIYCCMMISQNALNEYFKLKAIDVVESSSDLSNQEVMKFIDTLISSQKIKQFLNKSC